MLLLTVVVGWGCKLSAQITTEETEGADSGENAPLLVGIYSDVGYGYYHYPRNVFPGSSDCGIFSEGSIERGSFGAELYLPSFFSSTVGLLGRLLIDVSQTHLTTSAEPFTIADVEAGLIQFDHEYRFVEQTIASRLEFLGSLKLMDRLNLGFGGGVSYAISRTTQQTDYITDDLYRFANGLREQSMPRGEVSQSRWGAGGILSLETILPINYSLMFVPHLSIRAESYSLSSLTGKSGISASIGFSLLAEVGKSPPQPLLPVIPLSATIDLGISDSPERQASDSIIHVVEVLRGGVGVEWQIERKIYPPTLLINPEWESSKGIEKWEITFIYGEKEIGYISSQSAENLSELNWKIANDEMDESVQPLVAELIVSDSSGAVVEVTDQVQLSVQRSLRLVYDNGREVIRTDLPTNQNLPSQASRDLLQEIVEEAELGDRIVLQPRKIYGTDISPAVIEQMHVLAAELHSIMKERGQALRVDVLPVPEIAVDQNLYNSLPAGRKIDYQIELILQKR